MFRPHVAFRHTIPAENKLNCNAGEQAPYIYICMGDGPIRTVLTIILWTHPNRWILSLIQRYSEPPCHHSLLPPLCASLSISDYNLLFSFRFTQIAELGDFFLPFVSLSYVIYDSCGTLDLLRERTDGMSPYDIW